MSLLQELGYLYHIDDVSRDEPFIEQVNGTDFVVVPYTLRNNDILLIEGRNYSPEQFLAQIKLDFDQLYDEAGGRRRMMSVSAHDRISGTPQMVKVWDAFLALREEAAGRRVPTQGRDRSLRAAEPADLARKRNHLILGKPVWRRPSHVVSSIVHAAVGIGKFDEGGRQAPTNTTNWRR